ncbi:MAG: hypothetical protein ACPGTQ_00345 [Colwellia sp.]
MLTARRLKLFKRPKPIKLMSLICLFSLGLILPSHAHSDAEFTQKSPSSLAGNQDAPLENLAQSESTNELLAKLMINEGKGQFIQQKYFSFLAVPIKSSGIFIVSDSHALWQTNAPVFSQLLLSANEIKQRQQLEQNYTLLTNNTEFTKVLGTVFTGNINSEDWQITSNSKCLQLEPKSSQIKQLFNIVSLCLIENKLVGDGHKQQLNNREITLFDQQNNKTVIVMTLSQESLNEKELNALSENRLNESSLNKSNNTTAVNKG